MNDGRKVSAMISGSQDFLELVHQLQDFHLSRLGSYIERAVQSRQYKHQ